MTNTLLEIWLIGSSPDWWRDDWGIGGFKWLIIDIIEALERHQREIIEEL